MASVIPVVVCALLISGTIGSLWQLWSSRPGQGETGGAIDDTQSRLRALTKVAWANFLLIHALLLLLLSESREVPQGLSIVASAGGALAFLATLTSMITGIGLERKASAKK